MDQGQRIGDLAAIGRERLAADATRTARKEAAETMPYERLLTELIGLLDPLKRESFVRRLNGAVRDFFTTSACTCCDLFRFCLLKRPRINKNLVLR